MLSPMAFRAFAIGAAAGAFLMSAEVACASTVVTLNGSYTVAYTPNHYVSYGHTYSQGNGPGIHDLLSSNFTIQDLGMGGAVTTNFFTASPNRRCGSHCIGNTAMGTLTVTFSNLSLTETTDNQVSTLSLVTGSNLTETGIYQARYSGAVLPCAASDPASTHGQSDCINWSAGNNPINLTFQNENIIDTVSIALLDAYDWNITPKIKFAWIDGTTITHQATTPLPAALPLFMCGLGTFGLFGWWSKRKKGAVMVAA